MYNVTVQLWALMAALYAKNTLYSIQRLSRLTFVPEATGLAACAPPCLAYQQG
jgi:hypothetical protein